MRRLANMVLPVPGGPVNRIKCYSGPLIRIIRF